MYTLEGIKSDRKKSNYIIRKQISRRLSNCYRCPRKNSSILQIIVFCPRSSKLLEFTVGYQYLSVFYYRWLSKLKTNFHFCNSAPYSVFKNVPFQKGFCTKNSAEFFFFLRLFRTVMFLHSTDGRDTCSQPAAFIWDQWIKTNSVLGLPQLYKNLLDLSVPMGVRG